MEGLLVVPSSILAAPASKILMIALRKAGQQTFNGLECLRSVSCFPSESRQSEEEGPN